MGVREGTHRIPQNVTLDLFLIGSVVIPLIVLHYALPGEIYSSLAFRVGSPSIGAAVASAYLHVDTIAHLLTNVLAYMLIAIPLWWFHTVTGRRRQFWAVMGTFLLVVPIIVGAANYLWFHLVLSDPSNVTVVGFSGIVSGLGGYLIMSVLYFVASIDQQEIAQSLAGIIASILVASVIVVNADQFVTVLEQFSTPVLMRVLGPLAVVGVATTYRLNVIAPRSVSDWVENQTLEAVAVAVGTIAFAGVIVAGFSVTTIQGGVAVNVLSHGVGFVLGILASTAVEFANGL